MAYETVILQKEDHVATLLFNRPDKMNAVNIRMFDEIIAALDEVEKDDDIRALVISGCGRAFCSSVDLDIMRGDDGLVHKGLEGLRMFIRQRPQKITLGIRNLSKPTIAAVNGVAVADALDWVCACDFRFGGEKARFQNAFATLALFPNTGAAWLLPRLVGTAKALEILYLGEWVNAEEAHRVGILTHLVKQDDVVADATALARRIAAQAPITIKLLKTHVYRGQTMTLEEYLELAADGEAMTFFTEDAKEAFQAFAEKRKPNFKGK